MISPLMPTFVTKRASCPSRWLWLTAMVAAACDDGSKVRIDALEGRITELERGTTDTSRALEAAGTKATTTAPPTTLGTETIAELHEKPEVGLAECDEYLRKYRACVEDKMPAAARERMLDAIASSSKAFAEAAAGPGREAVRATCKSAHEGLRKSFVAMGCTW